MQRGDMGTVKETSIKLRKTEGSQAPSDGAVVGFLPFGATVTVVNDFGDGWPLIQSGTGDAMLTGFVDASNIDWKGKVNPGAPHGPQNPADVPLTPSTHPIPADVISGARSSQAVWGVPACVTIAQWALESGWGKHIPAGSNNPFGIKAGPNDPFVTASTQEFINNQWVTLNQNFRKFGSIAEAFDAHAKLLATSPFYATSRAYTGDIKKYVTAMSTVYATGPAYGAQVLTIIQADDLTRYDTDSKTAPNTVSKMLDIALDVNQLRFCQSIAAKKLFDFDGEIFPHDACAITLSVIFQQAGFDFPDTFMAIEMGRTLIRKGWQVVSPGHQQAGDIASTCGDAPAKNDHVYFVLKAIDNDEMLIADNQKAEPHSRFATGKGKTPATFFVRAPS